MINKIDYVTVFKMLTPSEKVFLLENLSGGRIVRKENYGYLEIFSPTSIHIAKGIANTRLKEVSWFHIESEDSTKLTVRIDSVALSVSIKQLWAIPRKHKKKPSLKCKNKNLAKLSVSSNDVIRDVIQKLLQLSSDETDLLHLVIKKSDLNQKEIKTTIGTEKFKKAARSLREICSHDHPWIIETEEFRGGMVVIWDRNILSYLKLSFKLSGPLL